MGSKSGKRKRKRTRKHKRKQRQEQFEHLKGKLEQGPFQGREIVIEPGGEVKMSEVLAEFVEPYRELGDTEDNYRKLLELAIAAWNASLLPEEGQQDMVDELFDKGMPTVEEEVKTGLKEIVNMLIARKRAYFADCRRAIVDFELTDTGSGYHLTVASAPTETPSEASSAGA